MEVAWHEAVTESQRAAFLARVRELYLANPGGISGVAYYKLAGMLATGRLFTKASGRGEALFALRDKQLVFYHADTPPEFSLPQHLLQSLDFLVLHHSYYKRAGEDLSAFRAESFFPLFYDFSFTPAPWQHERYSIIPFDFTAEADYKVTADIITGTGAGYTVTPERVRGWLREPAFDPTLWFLAKERAGDTPVGVGISAYHAPTREADLDWFFVATPHQGQGIGRGLVAATVAACSRKAAIIRLGGIADGFYEKCGFRRGEEWYLLRRGKA